MNILVFGKDGQLGRAFRNQLERPQFQKGNVFQYIGRQECDLTDPRQITSLLHAFNPQLIINAAAYTAVDKAETESEIAFAINKTAPELMAQYAAQHDATVLHFSTDYVFDGTKFGAYTELDQTNPLSVYGKSKVAGELAITNAFANNTNGQYAILRTSWLYGDGNNFIRIILALAKEQADLLIANDQYGAPTSACWLAEVSCNLVINEAGGIRRFISGIYHAVPRGQTTRYALAYQVVKLAMDFGVPLQTNLASIKAIRSSEYRSKALRPMNSSFSIQKLQLEFERLGVLLELPHWNEQVNYYVGRLIR